MGGFMLYKDGKAVQTLSIQRFGTLLRAGAIDFPSTTKADIRDRSRMHPVLAAITLLQCIWFFTQCIARLAGGLLITQLEVATLALLGMNGLFMAFWWHKPLDVRYPIRIDTRFDLRRALPEPGPRTVKDDFKRENSLGLHMRLTFFEEYQPPDKPPIPFENRIIKFIFRMLITWPLKSLFRDVGRLAISIQSASVAEGALKVPLFYAPDTSDFLQFALLPALFIGSIFGGVHCIFWSYGSFPTEFSHRLWRIASVTAAGFSALCLILLLLILATQLWNQVSFNVIVDIVANFFIYLGICLFLFNFLLYVAARLALLIECFICLQSLPPTALRIVPWTNYIPHFS